MAKISIDIENIKESLTAIGYEISDCIERENNGFNWQIKFYNSGAIVTIYDTNTKKNTVVNGKYEEGENKILDMISAHAFDLIVNVPKNHTKRELTNGYKIRRGAIDHNIPLLTNARLAKSFIESFCAMKLEDIQIKSWQEY
jgi:carbamoyl-phosphate synthase large subunit